MPEQPAAVISTEQLAELLHCSRWSLYAAIKDGDPPFPYVKVNGRSAGPQRPSTRRSACRPTANEPAMSRRDRPHGRGAGGPSSDQLGGDERVTLPEARREARRHPRSRVYRETPEYLDAVQRMLRALGRRVAEGSPP